VSRQAAIAAAREHVGSGAFLADLARRVAIRTESQDPSSTPALRAYLEDEIGPSLAALGFTWTVHDNPPPARSSSPGATSPTRCPPC
jgi:hypothetical protein